LIFRRFGGLSTSLPPDSKKKKLLFRGLFKDASSVEAA
jgi:hypothetical protein